MQEDLVGGVSGTSPQPIQHNGRPQSVYWVEAVCVCLCRSLRVCVCVNQLLVASFFLRYRKLWQNKCLCRRLMNKWWLENWLPLTHPEGFEWVISQNTVCVFCLNVANKALRGDTHSINADDTLLHCDWTRLLSETERDPLSASAQNTLNYVNNLFNSWHSHYNGLTIRAGCFLHLFLSLIWVTVRPSLR